MSAQSGIATGGATNRSATAAHGARSAARAMMHMGFVMPTIIPNPTTTRPTNQQSPYLHVSFVSLLIMSSASLQPWAEALRYHFKASSLFFSTPQPMS